MQDEVEEKREEIELICSLLEAVEQGGNRWAGKPLPSLGMLRKFELFLVFIRKDSK